MDISDEYGDVAPLAALADEIWIKILSCRLSYRNLQQAKLLCKHSCSLPRVSALSYKRAKNIKSFIENGKQFFFLWKRQSTRNWKISWGFSQNLQIFRIPCSSTWRDKRQLNRRVEYLQYAYRTYKSSEHIGRSTHIFKLRIVIIGVTYHLICWRIWCATLLST